MLITYVLQFSVYYITVCGFYGSVISYFFKYLEEVFIFEYFKNLVFKSAIMSCESGF